MTLDGPKCADSVLWTKLIVAFLSSKNALKGPYGSTVYKKFPINDLRVFMKDRSVVVDVC